jgi:hypothetical protein
VMDPKVCVTPLMQQQDYQEKTQNKHNRIHTKRTGKHKENRGRKSWAGSLRQCNPALGARAKPRHCAQHRQAVWNAAKQRCEAAVTGSGAAQ